MSNHLNKQGILNGYKFNQGMAEGIFKAGLIIKKLKVKLIVYRIIATILFAIILYFILK